MHVSPDTLAWSAKLTDPDFDPSGKGRSGGPCGLGADDPADKSNVPRRRVLLPAVGSRV